MSEIQNTVWLNNEALTVRSISVSDMANNVYVLTSKVTGQQVVIDAADDFPTIERFANEAARQDYAGAGEALGVMYVLTTHGHWDHIRALPQAAEEFDANTYAGQADIPAIQSQENFTVQEALLGGETLSFDGYRLETISLVGHTPGSIAFVLRTQEKTLLFTGDSLFPGGVGKTNSDADFRSLFEEVKSKLFGEFEDDALVLPGHGDSTTLGAERGSLDEWEARGW